MTASAPKIGPRLLGELRRLDNGRLPIAELSRRLGRFAERRGLTRPSYEQVRILVHRERALRRGPSTAEVLVDVAFRVRPPAAVLNHASGLGVPTIR